MRSPGRLRNRPWRTSRRRSLLVPNVIIGLHSVERPVLRQQRRKAAARAAWAQVVPAELFDEFGVEADDPVAALDAGLARGNPRRRLPDGSKGCLGVMVAVHDRPPRHPEQENRSLRSAGAASRFPPERTPGHGRAPSGMSAHSPCEILCINIQTGRLHVEPTAGLLECRCGGLVGPAGARRACRRLDGSATGEASQSGIV